MATYSLTLRQNLNRKMTIEELDENFLYLLESYSIGSTGPQGDIGPQGFQGDIGPQGPGGSGGGARFIKAILPNSPGSTSPLNFELALPWPYDYVNGMSISNEYIFIDNSDSVKFYNVMLSFQIYNAANESYGYSLKYNTGSGTYSLFDTNINGSTDNNKSQTFNDIIRVPAGVTASLYFLRYTTQSDEENVLGSLNIIEII